MDQIEKSAGFVLHSLVGFDMKVLDMMIVVVGQVEVEGLDLCIVQYCTERCFVEESVVDSYL